MIRTRSSTIRRREMDAVLTCMVDEHIGPGDMNRRLVQSVKEFTGADGCAAVRSPVIALSYILSALGLEKGSRIMISALAPAWQYLSVEALGYVPLVLDVDQGTAQITAETARAGAEQGGRLLLVHEALGIMPDMEALLAVGVPLVEDLSMSLGAARAEKKAGMWGCFSILGLEENDAITAGGGAVVIAPARREWTVLKRIVEAAPLTDVLPDLNCALAYVQLKEFPRNEERRRELHALYRQSLRQSRHTSFSRGVEQDADTQDGGQEASAVCFPVLLSSGQKEVRQYALRKDIEIANAFEGSVAALKQGELDSCLNADSLFLRTVLFPLYPRLSKSQIETIIKVLSSLP